MNAEKRYLKISKPQVIDYFFITLGVALLAFAILLFWQPHGLVTGGVTGLAIIIFYYTESAGLSIPTIPTWLTTFVLNLPLFALGFKIVPREYLVRSVYGYMMLVLWMWIFNFLPPVHTDILMAALSGGVIAGLGVGLVFRSRATTGGSTLVAIMLHRWIFRHYSVAKILFVLDAIVIMVGLYMFGANTTMYAILAVFVSAKLTGAVIEGLSFSKAAFIISNESDAISEKIMTEINRGVTKISSRGGFTKTEQNLLLCVMPAKEIINLKQLVYSIDERAFVIVTDVREVLGEGFKPGQDSL